MSRNDFSDLGDQIKDMVQGAVKNMDFEKLNREISGTVGRALDEVKASMGVRAGDPEDDPKRPFHSPRYRYRGSNEPAQGWGNTQTPRPREAYYGARPQMSRNLPRPVFGKAKGAVAGILSTVFGGIGTFSFGIAELSIASASAAGYVGGAPTLVSMTILAPFFLGSLAALAAGIRINGRTRRFKRYLYRIGQASFITMEELSASSGKSLEYVRRDVRRMIEDGMFPSGHIDPEGKYLILNDETYRLYQATRTQQMEMKNQQIREEDGGEDAVDESGNASREQQQKQDELGKVMKIGEEYAGQLKEARMAMAEKEISLKLTRLEMIIRKIFQCVELNPEKLPEIEKFTEYYLPTTLKLVNTYRDFEREPIQGDNIKKAKTEISQTLNTIIQAFENLLDSMYEDVAMDISTDITVLETMLRQEGLTDSEFDKMKESM